MAWEARRHQAPSFLAFREDAKRPASKHLEIEHPGLREMASRNKDVMVYRYDPRKKYFLASVHLEN